MKSWALSAALLSLALILPHRADARSESLLSNYRSPQNFALELRLGPYRPEVDSEFGGTAKPYETMFGGGSGFYFGTELDWQIFDFFGTLGIGGQLGFVSQSAQALTGDGMRSSADGVGFRMLPMALLLVYRLDELALRIPWLPFVPYGKFGLNYNIWWFTQGNGDISNGFSPSGQPGRGLGDTWGYSLALGLSFMIDSLDPGARTTMDADYGINHTYLFFEYNRVFANGLSRADALRVGDSTWVAGLAFEF